MRSGEGPTPDDTGGFPRQHFLNFRPLPHGQGALRPGRVAIVEESNVYATEVGCHRPVRSPTGSADRSRATRRERHPPERVQPQGQESSQRARSHRRVQRSRRDLRRLRRRDRPFADRMRRSGSTARSRHAQASGRFYPRSGRFYPRTTSRFRGEVDARGSSLSPEVSALPTRLCILVAPRRSGSPPPSRCVWRKWPKLKTTSLTAPHIERVAAERSRSTASPAMIRSRSLPSRTVFGQPPWSHQNDSPAPVSPASRIGMSDPCSHRSSTVVK